MLQFDILSIFINLITYHGGKLYMLGKPVETAVTVSVTGCAMRTKWLFSVLVCQILF